VSGGSRTDRVLSAVQLLDGDGDGSLTLSELTVYLRAVLRVLHAAEGGGATAGAGTGFMPRPDDIAAAMASAAFEHAGTPLGGTISLDHIQM